MNARRLRLSTYVVGCAALLVAQTALPRPPHVIMRKPGIAKKSSVGAKVKAARMNNLGVAYMNQQQFPKALQLFTQAATVDASMLAAELNQGIVLLNMQKSKEARAHLVAALKRQPQSAAAWFNLGLLAKSDGNRPEAVKAFTRAAELAPDDADAFYFLGGAQADAQDYAAAVRSLQNTLRLNPFHVSAEFALARAYQRMGDPAQAREHLERFQHLTQKKLGSPISLIYGEQGKLSLAQPVMLPASAKAIANKVSFTDVSTAVLPSIPVSGTQGTGLCAIEEGDKSLTMLLDLGGKTQWLERSAAGRFAEREESGLSAKSVVACAAADFDNDHHADLAVSDGKSVSTFRNGGKETFEDVTAATGIKGSDNISSLTWWDYDHDGDLDLFVGRSVGAASLWRNNGNGTFTDVSAETGFAIPAAMMIPTDFNNDRAVDAVVISPTQPVRIIANPREGRFEPLSVWKGETPTAVAAAVADFDHDGAMDLLLAHAQAPAITLWRNDAGRLQPIPLPSSSLQSVSGIAVLDYDNDGWQDFAVIGENNAGTTGLHLFRNVGQSGFREVSRETGTEKLRLGISAKISAVDFDGDGDVDLVVTQSSGAPILLRNDGGNRNHWLRVGLRGLNDNKSAIGTKFEVFAADLHEKLEITGLTGAGQSAVSTVVGIGSNMEADILRALWPTGVLQDEIQVAADQYREFLEIDRRGSSCPVLFAWDGERYRFVGDMIGSGVFGHWVAPGQLNVPDPTEYLKLEDVVPRQKDGWLSFRFMEPMEETVYVDQLRLLAVDHPADIDVFPNERFLSAPPFPDFKVVTAQGAMPPKRAVDGNGADVTAVLGTRDRNYVDGLKLLPFRGFTKTHTLDLDLATPYGGGPLRLLLYGYIEYFTATGMYAAHQAGIDPMAPALDAFVDGKWVRISDDVGFPAGLPRTIVVDLSEKLPRGTEKVRLTTNLQIYWDHILIDSSPPTETRTTEVPLAKAALAFHGYPREVVRNEHGDISYVYEQVSKTGPFTRQNGAYTRFGDVTKLVTRSDDRFAIFGSGEEIALDFDPASLPPLPAGWRRDYFFFADGYEKDMDFYAEDFLSVAPLPFREMDAYPRPGKSYPAERHMEYLLDNDRFGNAQPSGNYRFTFPLQRGGEPR